MENSSFSGCRDRRSVLLAHQSQRATNWFVVVVVRSDYPWPGGGEDVGITELE